MEQFLLSNKLGFTSPDYVTPFKYRPCTVILFYVRVPVLSVQISFAPPIVSEACSLHTRLFSLNI
jgi:hypothetical protein